MNPTLSICIPTRNRATYLRQVLERVCQELPELPSSAVEIVISDNCSDDDTPDIVKMFQERYPGRITYQRTTSNIGFGNLFQALRVAKGTYRKLSNDTLLFRSGTLSYMVKCVSRLREDEIPYFANGHAADIGDDTSEVAILGLEDFIAAVSYFNTWIGSFVLPDKDVEKAVAVFESMRWTEIPHTCWLLDMLANKRPVVVDNRHLFDAIVPKNKGGYNIAEVFGHNYLSVLCAYVSKGAMSARVYEDEKRKILKHINTHYFDIKRRFAFQKTGYFKWMFPYYRTELYFYIAYLKVLFRLFRYGLLRR